MMARTDWVALVTDPAAEYVARTELERFGTPLSAAASQAVGRAAWQHFVDAALSALSSLYPAASPRLYLFRRSHV
jgi:hypothetical protein